MHDPKLFENESNRLCVLRERERMRVQMCASICECVCKPAHIVLMEKFMACVYSESDLVDFCLSWYILLPISQNCDNGSIKTSKS